MRVAFIGAGGVAAAHHSALTRVTGTELVAVHDIDPERCRAMAARWDVAAYEGLESLLAAPEIDAVHVLTPHATHAELALRALKAGKHVLVEKPVGSSLAEIERLVEARDAFGLVVMPSHNYAYTPEFRRIVRLALDGELGRLRALFVTYAIKHPPDVPARYGGAIEDLMVHEVYLALAVLGKPDRVWAGASSVPAGAEDQAWLVLGYEDGSSAHLFASFAVDDHGSDPWSFHLKLLGSEGAGSLTWRDVTVNRQMNEFISFTIPAYQESFEHVNVAFRDAVEHGAPLLSTVEDALECARVIAAAYASVASGAAVRLREEMVA